MLKQHVFRLRCMFVCPYTYVCMYVHIMYYITEMYVCTYNSTIHTIQGNGTTSPAMMTTTAITSASVMFVFVVMTFFSFRLFPITYKVDIWLVIVIVVVVLIVIIIFIVIYFILRRQYGTITTNFFRYINQRWTNIKILIDKCGILLRSHFRRLH